MDIGGLLSSFLKVFMLDYLPSLLEKQVVRRSRASSFANLRSRRSAHGDSQRCSRFS